MILLRRKRSFLYFLLPLNILEVGGLFSKASNSNHNSLLHFYFMDVNDSLECNDDHCSSYITELVFLVERMGSTRFGEGIFCYFRFWSFSSVVVCIRVILVVLADHFN